MKARPTIIALTAIGLAAIVTGSAIAAIHTESITYKQGDTELRGYLAYDDATDDPRPGVLIVHEWWGLNEYARERAEALAKEGYIAFAVDMYGEGKTTEHPQEAGEWASWIRSNKDVGAARFRAGREVLENHKLFQKGQIAAIGYCFGGSVVLTMAINGADLAGVVSFHGGLPVDPPTVDKIPAKILVCHGAADPTISQEQIQTFTQNLEAVHADYQFICYGGAKHSFTNPAADEKGIPALAYDPDADRRSWKAMLVFFDEIFAD